MVRTRRYLAATALMMSINLLMACALPGRSARLDSLSDRLDKGTGEPGRPIPIRDIASLLPPRSTARDALVATGELELDWLLDEVIRRNPSLEAKRRAWMAAEARAPQVGSLDDPEISFMFAPRLLDRVGQGSESRGMGEPMERGFAYKPEIRQKLPWPGKRGLRSEAAEDEADGAFHDAMEIRERLVDQTKEVYYEYFLASRALEINIATIGILEDAVATAESLYEAGTAGKQDALQAEVDLERVKHHRIELNRRKAVARARINALLNRQPDSGLPEPPKALPLAEAPSDFGTLQEEALRSRPELQSAAARLDALAAEVELARKEFYPDFMVSAAFDTFWQETDLRPMLGFGLNIPIQVGRRRAALTEAEERWAAAQAELEEAAAQVTLEVEIASQRLIEAVHGSEIFEGRILPAAAENLEAALAGYESGVLPLSAVLMAQKDQMDVELEAIQLQVEARRRFAELERAVGRSLQPAAGPGHGHPTEDQR